MNIGLRLRSKSLSVGVICELKKFHQNGELHIIIEWKGIGKVQYTESMLYECFSNGTIEIDKQYYREEKLKMILCEQVNTKN